MIKLGNFDFENGSTAFNKHIMEQDGGWKSGRKSVDKSLLKNIIRHTDAHNKVKFESFSYISRIF